MKKLPFTPFAQFFVKFCLIISPVMFVLYIAFAAVFYPNLIPSYIAMALISFGGKALYLVEQDGYGICNRKRNKKKFFELFDFLATGG